MKTDHPDLRETYQAYASSHRFPGRKKCPSPQAIARSFAPKTPVRKKKKIIDHISACPMCREEFMMFFEHHKTPSSDPIADLPKPPGDIRKGLRYPALWQGALALLGLSLIVYSFFFIGHRAEVSGTRQLVSSEITLLSPERELSLSSPAIFRWQATPGSEYYVVELFDETLLPVWVSDKTQDLQVQLPSKISLNLRPGQPYFWTVTAYIRGSACAESRLLRFDVRR